MSSRVSFSLSVCPYTSCLPFKTQSHVDCTARPLHKQPDFTKEEHEKLKKWAEENLLLQLVESTINPVTGKEGPSNSNSSYTDQLANPSLSSTQC